MKKLTKVRIIIYGGLGLLVALSLAYVIWLGRINSSASGLGDVIGRYGQIGQVCDLVKKVTDRPKTNSTKEGGVQGVVTSSENCVLSGVNVTAISKSTRESDKTTSVKIDQYGTNFTIKNLLVASDYEVTFKKAGFHDLVVPSIAVIAGKYTSIPQVKLIRVDSGYMQGKISATIDGKPNKPVIPTYPSVKLNIISGPNQCGYETKGAQASMPISFTFIEDPSYPIPEIRPKIVGNDPKKMHGYWSSSYKGTFCPGNYVADASIENLGYTFNPAKRINFSISEGGTFDYDLRF